jgi:hypothetical protein
MVAENGATAMRIAIVAVTLVLMPIIPLRQTAYRTVSSVNRAFFAQAAEFSCWMVHGVALTA